MRRRIPLRRFHQEVVRRRQGPGGRDDVGEYQEGPLVRTILPALVQPISLEDNNLVGGVQLSERLTIHVPVAVQRTIEAADALTWNDGVLSWNGSPLNWGKVIGELIPAETNPLAAAFLDRGADEVEYDDITYVVVESQLWTGSHCRAILLRET